MHAMAKRRMHQGRLDAALIVAEHSILVAPKQAEFLVTKSRLHTQRKERAAAGMPLLQAVNLDPKPEWLRQILREAEAG